MYPDLPDSDVRVCDVGYFKVLDFCVRADLLVQIHYKDLEVAVAFRNFPVDLPNFNTRIAVPSCSSSYKALHPI